MLGAVHERRVPLATHYRTYIDRVLAAPLWDVRELAAKLLLVARSAGMITATWS